MDPTSSEPRSSLGDQTENQPSSLSKRSLLKAAWVPPVIFAISLPHASYAANISGTDKHRNESKDDKGHGGGDNKGPGGKK
jgi:hypothetical protein